MPDLFNDSGNLVNDTANNRVRQVVTLAQQYLECLADSGATVEELKAVTCVLLEELTWVSRQVIIDRDIAIKRKEREDAKEAKD